MLGFQGGARGGLFIHESDFKRLNENNLKRHYEQRISDYKNQLRSLACRLTMTEDIERRSVMQELHDGTVQDLAGVQIKLGALRKLASHDGLSGIIDEIRGEVDHTIQNIRSMIFENSSHLLDEKGIVGAVEWLANKMSHQHGLPIGTNTDTRIEMLDRTYQAFLFRTIREFLINTVKHAGASEAKVSIKKSRKNLQVDVSDNGKGFDTRAMKTFAGKKHFGISNIIERTRNFNGRVKIKSEPGKGTHIKLVLPMG